ncbi:superoxide dismutase [Litchfieldia salsa]|uniref:superoxide dismutase n=1 Tax=Litchfieldia salsa TaxID=930152 RepID=A0A1H0WGK5_9BACI|nr:superoxide dismutase [Litchfieldia salsa]SDP89728.1 superoxide dismutase, Fe-Mn family [Litchfieldia salsa]
MSNQLSYKQYIQEVTLWAEQLETLLGEMRTEDNEAKKSKNEISDLLNLLNSFENEIQYEDIVSIKEKVDILYQDSSSILQTNRQTDERLNLYNGIKIGEHKLPPLPYSYDALEPYIASEIMELHHKKHHQSYVDGLNKAERMMEKARQTGEFDLIKHWEREAAFHGSGHYLHTIFWNVMNPRGKKIPTGKLLNKITEDFGSFDAFKQHFTEAAKKVEGVGWAILVWSTRSHKLEILQSERHQMLTQWDTIPLLVLDVWEHAYYLQYKNERADYVQNWWNIVDWNEVENRFKEASKLQWKPF